MPARKRKPADGYDHRFKAIHDRAIKWESDDIRGLLTLPPGVKVKVMNFDPAMKRIDMKVKFPPGYVEPAHQHVTSHCVVVIEGEQALCRKLRDVTTAALADGRVWPRCSPESKSARSRISSNRSRPGASNSPIVSTSLTTQPSSQIGRAHV